MMKIHDILFCVLITTHVCGTDLLYKGDEEFEAELTSYDNYFYGTHDVSKILNVYPAGDAAIYAGGNDQCPCLTGDELYDLTGISDTYGLQCAQHDVNKDLCAGHDVSDIWKPVACHGMWCYVHHQNCNLDHGISNVYDMPVIYSYATCGNYDNSQYISTLEDATVRYTILGDTGIWAYIGGNCGKFKSADYPQGCVGLPIDIADEFQLRGGFNVEYVQAFPNEFWFGWSKFCTFVNGQNFDTKATVSPHICSGQKWTVCAYAAGLGYTDLCVGGFMPSPERMEYAQGHFFYPMTFSLYALQAAPETNFFNFSVFQVWTAELWLVTLMYIVFMAFICRVVGGYYKLFRFSWPNVFLEFIDCIWWGFGMFFDFIFPQDMPTTLAKILIVCLEMSQCLMLATITATLTMFLLLDVTVSIESVDDIKAKGGLFCCITSVEWEMMKAAQPSLNMPPEQLFILSEECPTCDASFLYTMVDNGECTGVGLADTEKLLGQGDGVLCGLDKVKTLFTTFAWMPASSAIINEFNAFWGGIYNDGTLRSLQYKMTQSITPSQNLCEMKNTKTSQSLNLNQLSGLYSIGIGAAMLCLICYLVGVNQMDRVRELHHGQTDLGFRSSMSFGLEFDEMAQDSQDTHSEDRTAKNDASRM